MKHKCFLSDDTEMDAIFFQVKQEDRGYCTVELTISDGHDLINFWEYTNQTKDLLRLRNKISNLRNCIDVFTEELDKVIKEKENEETNNRE